MSEDPGLPTIVMSGDEVAAEHHFDLFHESNAPMCDTAPIGDPDAFRVKVVDYLVDDLLVGRLRFGPQLLRRTCAHVDAGGTDWVAVVIQHEGGVRGEAGRGTAIDMQPDRVGFLNYSQPFTAVFGQQESNWILVPRERIDRADELPPAATIDRASVRGRIAAAAIEDVWSRALVARAGDADQLAGEIVETVNTIVDPDEFTPTDRDIAVAMRDFVGANLSNLDLSVDELRAAFHCSRATVYRSFERHGGVAAYIREQRLLRCFHELSRPAKLPRLVSEIATRWGFENPSHFNRRFKTQFGLAPSDVVGATRATLGRTAYARAVREDNRFREWATLA